MQCTRCWTRLGLVIMEELGRIRSHVSEPLDYDGLALQGARLICRKKLPGGDDDTAARSSLTTLGAVQVDGFAGHHSWVEALEARVFVEEPRHHAAVSTRVRGSVFVCDVGGNSVKCGIQSKGTKGGKK